MKNINTKESKGNREITQACQNHTNFSKNRKRFLKKSKKSPTIYIDDFRSTRKRFCCSAPVRTLLVRTSTHTAPSLIDINNVTYLTWSFAQSQFHEVDDHSCTDSYQQPSDSLPAEHSNPDQRERKWTDINILKFDKSFDFYASEESIKLYLQESFRFNNVLIFILISFLTASNYVTPN